MGQVNAGKHRRQLELRLKRAKELYELGDYTKAEYLSRRDDILRQVEALEPATRSTEDLERLARFLADVSEGWAAAPQELRNKLVRTLFDQVWLVDRAVVAVKPRPELEPFFRLNYEEFVARNIEVETQTRVHLSRADHNSYPTNYFSVRWLMVA